MMKQGVSGPVWMTTCQSRSDEKTWPECSNGGSTPVRDLPPLRDIGLLGSAATRPPTTAFGDDAYADLWSKAAALLQSILANQVGRRASRNRPVTPTMDDPRPG